MKVSLHPAAAADVEAAAEFYEREGSPALAARFVAEFGRVSKLLLAHPGMGAPRPGGRRGFGMSVFPYTLIYRQTDHGIRVLVVKHDRRQPGYGGSRR